MSATESSRKTARRVGLEVRLMNDSGCMPNVEAWPRVCFTACRNEMPSRTNATASTT